MNPICAGPGCGNRTARPDWRYCSRACRTVVKLCAAPGCGRSFETVRPHRARFCSEACRTDFGAWSFPAAHPTNARVLGVTQ